MPNSNNKTMKLLALAEAERGRRVHPSRRHETARETQVPQESDTETIVVLLP